MIKKWLRYPAGIIRARIPVPVMRYWNEKLEKNFRHKSVSGKENKRLLEEFQLGQISIVIYGSVLLLLSLLILFLWNNRREDLTFWRNPFGLGDKEIALYFEEDGRREELSLTLGEKSLSESKRKQIYQEFFEKLEQVLKGENPSLEKVNQSLDFVESLEGYPFAITYEPEDISYIDWNGDLTETSKKLKKDVKTTLTVEASYKDYCESRIYEITLVPPENRKLSTVEELRGFLLQKESSTRNQPVFSIEDTWKNIRIQDASYDSMWILPFLIFLVSGLLLLRSHAQLREQEKERHQQNMEDFPLIVHLLTLYMGAGLSFPSAVERMGRDYEQRRRSGERYAFEQIIIMDRCMKMGLRPKEVCINWGGHFKEKVYGKFAMLLSQSLSKGSKEIRSMMEKEQQDAFQVQVEYVKREGEQASTKLLFPMVLLLFIVMLLIMFPAMMQFYQL